MKSLVIIVLFITVSVCSELNDSFVEELLLSRLPSGDIYSYFQFTTEWESDSKYVHHCNLFPRSLSEILYRFGVQELHVSLTEGLWRYENWGYPVVDAPPGAEVWAWFSEDVVDVDFQWKRLTEALSGLLCASLNFIDESTSQIPKYSFRPLGIHPDKNVNNSYIRYSTLPQEIVCTENLTPWKKLLPCDSKRGLATLLNSAEIHNTRYHSLQLSVRPMCGVSEKCSRTTLQLRQSVSLVYDPALLIGNRNWSFRKLFGQGLAGSCPIASQSNIYVDITDNSTDPFKITPAPTKTITSMRGGTERKFAVYDIKLIRNMMNIAISYDDVTPVISPRNSPAIYANRYLIGYGQERGGIATRIYNNHWSSLNIVLFENLPWFIPVYLHTLQVKVDDKVVKPLFVHYVPGRERIRPYHLEVGLKLPPRSITVISIDFDYVFLKWQEYPPDANHGFYIGSAVISCMLPVARDYTGIPQDKTTIAESFNASRRSYPVYLRTETLLVTLPTPDFSMPYNVICLACTVVALAFGPLHNITTKRLRLRPPQDSSVGPKAKIRKFFKKLFCRSTN